MSPQEKDYKTAHTVWTSKLKSHDTNVRDA